MISIPFADMLQAYSASNFTGKLIVWIQIIISIAVWSVMFGKYLELKRIEKFANLFRSKFSSSPTLLDFYFQRKRGTNPLIVVYTAACDKLFKLLSPGRGDVNSTSIGIEGHKLSAGQFSLVKGITEEALAKQQIVVDNNMYILALGSSLTPLIGLLGTVLGILSAFQEMGVKGSALLSDVAPGLSSALLTTVVGLLVAIPSACGYNILLEKTRKISAAMDGFTDELLARMTIEFSDSAN